MIDLTRLRREPDIVKAALARRGVSPEVMDAIILMDVEHRELLQEAERLRAEVKFLSRLVGEARRDKDAETAEKLTEKSRRLGDEERVATEAMERVGALLHDELLMIPNLPAPEAPDGADENDNVELRRWWVGMDEGLPFPPTPSTRRCRTGTSHRTRHLGPRGRCAPRGLDVPAVSRRRRSAPSRAQRVLTRSPPRCVRRDPSADVRADRDDDVHRPPAQIF